MIDVKDRLVQYPYRYRLEQVAEGLYNLIASPGTVVEEGTPINKELFDSINADILKKVDKETGKSLVLDTLIAKLQTLYTKDEIDALFVKQIEGKGLSTNDFTNEYKAKLNDAIVKTQGANNKNKAFITDDNGTQILVSKLPQSLIPSDAPIDTAKALQRTDGTVNNADIIPTKSEVEKQIKDYTKAVELSSAFTQRITASDDTGSKYEIKDGAIAVVKSVSGYCYKSSNLLNIADKTATTTNGITYSISGGVITLNGTASEVTIIWLPIDTVVAGTYSWNTFTPSNLRSYNLEMALALSYNNYSNRAFLHDAITGTFTSNYDYTYLQLYIYKNASLSNLQIKPMLVQGSKAPIIFEPYHDGIVINKASYLTSETQLLNIDDKESTTASGITYSIKNGVVTLNGTTTDFFREFITLKTPIQNGTYYYKVFNKPEDSTGFFFDCKNSEGTTIINANTSATTTSNVTYLQFYIIKGFTCNNLQLKPMIVKGSNPPTNFYPYAKQTLTIPGSVELGYGLSLTDINLTNYVDFKNNLYVKNIKKIVLNGTEQNATVSSNDDNPSNYRYTFDLETRFVGENTNIAPDILLCDKLETIGFADGVAKSVEGITLYNNKRCSLYISGLNSLSAYQQYLSNNNLIVYYAIPTPTTTGADIVDRTYLAYNLGIETLNVNYPCLTDIVYQGDLDAQVVENADNIAKLNSRCDRLDYDITDGFNNVNNALKEKANSNDVYTKTEVYNKDEIYNKIGSIKYVTNQFKISELNLESGKNYLIVPSSSVEFTIKVHGQDEATNTVTFTSPTFIRVVFDVKTYVNEKTTATLYYGGIRSITVSVNAVTSTSSVWNYAKAYISSGSLAKYYIL